MSQLGPETGQLSPSRFKAALFATLIIAALLTAAAPVGAAFPGGNGKIAYVRDVTELEGFPTGHIWTMNPDGTGQTDLSGNAGFRDTEPAWSADGSKIAFGRRKGT